MIEEVIKMTCVERVNYYASKGKILLETCLEEKLFTWMANHPESMRVLVTIAIVVSGLLLWMYIRNLLKENTLLRATIDAYQESSPLTEAEAMKISPTTEYFQSGFGNAYRATDRGVFLFLKQRHYSPAELFRLARWLEVIYQDLKQAQTKSEE